jgi:hypothetical protein
MLLYQIDVFERIVFESGRLRKQNLCASLETGVCTWRNVRWFPKLQRSAARLKAWVAQSL